ncbi:MAG TPA: DNA polymerase III subunit alpha [Chloroflexia bacterium]|nr:DNA polymerase III subunit alpha [Chloroflexia bacterium]
MGFVHLHCHSGYSLLEGTATPQNLISTAKKQGMSALALTDHNSLYGAVSFYVQAQKSGIKPIVGMEIDLDEAGEVQSSSLVLLARNMDGYRNLCQLATVLRLNADPQALEPPGYNEEEEAPFWEDGVWGVPVFGFTDKPKKSKLAASPSLRLQKEPLLPRELLLSGRHARGLIALSGGRHGLVNSLVRRGKMEQAARSIGTLITAFGEGNVFIELQLLDDKDAATLPALISLANDMGVPIVATNDVLYLADKDAATARALASARKGIRRKYSAHTQAIGELRGDAALQEEVGTERYFKSADEMAHLFADYPQAIANTHFIAEQCNLELPLYKPLFPGVDLPSGETPFSKLWKLCFAGATSRYRPLTEQVLARLKHELEIIEALGFSAYFLVVYDIVRFAQSKDIPIMARGSAANSLVAYVLGITQVDPIQKDLLFERFLNPARAEFEMPDIDLDVCWRGRDQVLHYIYERYGRDHVATVGTHITFRLRSAWREMAKVMGVRADRISYMANRLPHAFDYGDDSDSTGDPDGSGDIEAMEEALEYEALSDAHDEENDTAPTPKLRDDNERTAFALAHAIEGLPRHAGMHCAAVVITPDPLANLVPLQRAARDPSMAITQYDKDAIEVLGLVKMDILGSRALTTLVDAVQASGMATGKGGKGGKGGELEKWLQAIPIDDERTYRMMAEGDTLGCFQLESPGMRGLLKWLRPRNLDDVAVAISLFRPGPLEGGFLEAFVRRHVGQEEISYLHPSMEEILRNTKGVILFQEQFLKLVHKLAGLNLGEAEKLRKALGKTRSADERTQMGSQFVAGAIERGIDQLQAQKVWEIIAGYTGFGFCAAHAHSYALTAYRSAYMKAHYPAMFLAAQINNGGGYYGPSVYVEDARRLRIKLLVPHVNESGSWCEVPTGSGEQRSIRFGLQFVKGLSEKTVAAILNERRNGGRFHSLLDLMARVEMGPQEITALVKVGACDNLGGDASIPSIASIRGSMGETIEAVYEPIMDLNRKQMMRLLPALLSTRSLTVRSTSRQSIADRLFATGSDGKGMGLQIAIGGDFIHPSADRGAGGGIGNPKILGRNTLHIDVPQLDDYTPTEKLKLEQEALGFTLSHNEMEWLEVPGAIPSSELHRYADHNVKVAGIAVAGRRHRGKDGKWMLFLSIQDRDGLIEVVLFSDAYQGNGKVLVNGGHGPFIITGRVQVSGKGRGVGVQPPDDLRHSDTIALKMHPVVIADEVKLLSAY